MGLSIFERRSRLSRIVFHIDVNSAFLSWSALERLEQNPDSVDLRTIPSAVAGDVASRRGGVAARENAGDEAVAVFVIHGALTRLLATWLSTDIDEELVSKHFMSNTGTSTFEWAPDFAPASADELAKGLHALTWNDRPLDQWS